MELYNIDDMVIANICLDGVDNIEDGCLRIIPIAGKIIGINIDKFNLITYSILIKDHNRGRNLEVHVNSPNVITKIDLPEKSD